MTNECYSTLRVYSTSGLIKKPYSEAQQLNAARICFIARAVDMMAPLGHQVYSVLGCT